MKNYHQLTFEQRYQISALLKLGFSKSAIAKELEGAFISSEEVEYSEGSMGYGGDAKIKPDGRFSLARLNGLRYLIRAYVSTAEGKQHHAEPIEIPADGNVNNLKLVITEPNGNCEKCSRWTRKIN